MRRKVLALWKWALSFRKRDWDLADYPVELLSFPNPVAPGVKVRFPEAVFDKYLARIVCWETTAAVDRHATKRSRSLPRTSHGRRRTGAIVRPCRDREPTCLLRSPATTGWRLTANSSMISSSVCSAWRGLGSRISRQSRISAGVMTEEQIRDKIREVYEVDVADTEDGNIADILDRIAAQRMRRAK